MGYYRSIVVLLLVASAPAQDDPTDILIRAREQLLPMTARLSTYSCTETIDHSYFSRVNPPEHAPSCDQLSVNRRKARYKLKLYATDRIRYKVFIVGEREMPFWHDPLKFESHDVEEVVATEPIDTGAFGAFYADPLQNPDARFQYLGNKDGRLEFGFRESAEDSLQFVRAGGQWLATAHSGSFLINPASLDFERFTVETTTLPPQTSMCEVTSTADYRRVRIGAEDVPLPQRAEFRHVLINTQETTSVIAYSSCDAERPPIEKPVKSASILPENLPVVLALDHPIDTETAAAGDLVSAIVRRPVKAKDSGKILLNQGTQVRGRIVNMGHRLSTPDGKANGAFPEGYFMIAISFEVVEIDGVVSPLHLRLDSSKMAAFLEAGSNRWPEDTLVFPAKKNSYLVRAGFESKWLTQP